MHILRPHSSNSYRLNSFAAQAVAVAALGACSATASTPSAPTVATPLDAGAALDGASASDGSGASMALRGQRYCELLLVSSAMGGAHVDVYTTFGLNDCPDAAWNAVDANKVAMDEGVLKAILNGPRYWTLDRFVAASFVDSTPKTLGGLAMRHAASIDLPLSALSSLGSAPYTTRTIQRKTTVRFEAGRAVYELVAPDGKIYDMQSYSVQKQPQTEADVAALGAKLTLPAGWSYRTRTLTEPLEITAIGGLATVVQDDFENTYQQSQQ